MGQLMTAITAKPITATPITARPLTAYRLGESTEGANPLVWHALAAANDGVITDQLVGVGTPTWAHTSSLLLPDYQGVYRTIGAGEAPIVGARWVGGVPYATDELGDPLTDWWFQCQPAYTNSLTYSNDLTNAAWTKSNTTASLDAVGITGAPNTATTFTDSDGANLGYINRYVTIPDDSNPLVMRYFIEKDSDTSRYPRLGIRIIDGTTQLRENAIINTSTGAIAAQPNNEGTTEVNDAGLFWEVLSQVTNNSSGNVRCQITPVPAYNSDGSATADSSATGSIIVGNIELHLNKTIAQVRGSAPIITAASTVSTTAVYGTFDIANHDNSTGAYYLEMSPAYASGEGGSGVSLRMNVNSGQPVYAASDRVYSRDSDGVAITGVMTFAANDVLKIGAVYSLGENSKQAIENGNASAVYTYSGYTNGDGVIFLDAPNGTAHVRRYRNLRRYDLDYAAGLAKLLELTA